jgi:hypothetical protein
MNKIEIKEYNFSISELEITPQEVYKVSKMDMDMPSYDDFIISEMKSLFTTNSVNGGLAIIDTVNLTKDSIVLNNETFKVGRQIAYDLKHSEKAALFLCTAGSKIGERSQELMNQGDLLEGYLIDVLGSITVEKAMDKISEILKIDLQKTNLVCTNRYSPGYCDWKVYDQKQLFSFFPENFANITLTESCLMSPIKSVSGIIGIGKEVKFNNYRCEICQSKNCIYRQVLDKV